MGGDTGGGGRPPASRARRCLALPCFHRIPGLQVRTVFDSPGFLCSGDDIPEWFAFKSVVKVLREETPSSGSDSESS